MIPWCHGDDHRRFRWTDLRKHFPRPVEPPKVATELEQIRAILDPQARADAFARWKAELYVGRTR